MSIVASVRSDSLVMPWLQFRDDPAVPSDQKTERDLYIVYINLGQVFDSFKSLAKQSSDRAHRFIFRA